MRCIILLGLLAVMHTGYSQSTSWSGNYFQITNPSNHYVRIGSGNSGYAHFYTDRPKFYFNKRLELSNGISSYTNQYLKIETPTGILNIGSGNSTYSHFNTDRSRFYFNKDIEVDGSISAYSGQLSLGVAGGDKVTILANGNLGVGTINPSYKLDVNGQWAFRQNGYFYDSRAYGYESSTGKYLQYYVSGGKGRIGMQGSEDLILQANGGNIGIGSTSPSKLLHVRGNPEDDNDSDILAIFENSASSSEDAGIAIKGSRNGSTGTVSFIDLDIYDNNESTPNFTMGRIGAGKSNGAGINGQLRFFTNNNGSLGERMRIKQDGKVGIGTTSPTKMLEVAGTAYAREVKVDVSAGADFVFEENYDLPTLSETAEYVKEHHHLPGIASAVEMESEGIDLGEMNIKLLQKIEELTLHLIELNRTMEAQQVIINELQKKID